MANPYKPVKGGLWNKSHPNILKITHTSVTIHENQVKSLKHLHVTVNFAGFEIGLICTAAYARASQISGSYSNWSLKLKKTNVDNKTIRQILFKVGEYKQNLSYCLIVDIKFLFK